MVSRAYRNCEIILKSLIAKYGPTATVGLPLVIKEIRVVAGHDSRTFQKYVESLCKFEMIMPRKQRPFQDILDNAKVELFQEFRLNWKALNSEVPQQTLEQYPVKVKSEKS